jgi:hypothetical protein
MRKLLFLLLLSTTVAFAAKKPEQTKYSTFIELKEASAFPRWANTVCFMEKIADDQDILQDVPEDKDDATAAIFFVYGPKGDLGIQSEIYSGGKGMYDHWERIKSPSDTSSFMSVSLGGKNREGIERDLKIEWGAKPHYILRFSSTNTGQTKFRAEGHCHAL